MPTVWELAADRLESDAALETTLTADPPGCEATWTCPDHGTEQCDQAAAERVSVECTEPGCDNAAEVLLLCAACADDITEQHHAQRRPL